MSFSVEEGLRFFWLKSLAGIRGKTEHGLAGWIREGHFIVDSMPSSTELEIRPIFSDKLARAYAHDASKMACAAFESISSISECSRLPRSAGWIAIQAYYAAYFAAHSITRFCGSSCVQLESAEANKLAGVANLFANQQSLTVETGYYIATSDPTCSNLSLQKAGGRRKGSHEILWELFCRQLRTQSEALLRSSVMHQETVRLLADIEAALTQGGHNGGSWLSHIRNMVNYRHEYGVWYPYRGSDASPSNLVDLTRRWTGYPTQIQIRAAVPITQFVAVCTGIVSLCHLLVTDMHRSWHGGNSFHKYWTIGLKSLLELGAKGRTQVGRA